jgi:hypothetical protein
MFLRILLSNVIFAGMIWGYYVYVGGNRAEFMRGVILISIVFVCGVLIGAWLNRSMPKRVAKLAKQRLPELAAFDQIQ